MSLTRPKTPHTSTELQEKCALATCAPDEERVKEA
jgi:hypothetical protein